MLGLEFGSEFQSLNRAQIPFQFIPTLPWKSYSFPHNSSSSDGFCCYRTHCWPLPIAAVWFLLLPPVLYSELRSFTLVQPNQDWDHYILLDCGFELIVFPSGASSNAESLLVVECLFTLAPPLAHSSMGLRGQNASCSCLVIKLINKSY